MQKKFECLSCHCQFEADDQTIVRCPKCGSENVEIAHFHLPKGWWKWAGILAVAACLVFFLSKIDWAKQTEVEPENKDVVAEDTVPIQTFEEDSSYIDPDAPEFDKVPSISVGKPVYTDGGYTLSFKVMDAPNREYYVALLEHNGKNIIACSEDGKNITKIPVSEKEGMYDVAVFLKSNDSMLCAAKPVSGFKSQEVVKEKMTKELLQKLIEDDKSDLTSAQNWIVSDYKLHFKGLSSEDDSPTDLSTVQSNLLIWNKVTITEIKYDEKNRITDIYFDVQK